MSRKADHYSWRPGFEVSYARDSEVRCRAMGLFDTAVQWQQYADAMAARGEVYDCEIMPARRDD